MRAERARKRQAEVPAYGRKHATTARRPTLSPARAQTGICAHEKESTDAGGRRATTSRRRCAASAHRLHGSVFATLITASETQGVGGARRVRRASWQAWRPTALSQQAADDAVRQPLRDNPCSADDHASRQPAACTSAVSDPRPRDEDRHTRGQQARGLGGGATATGGADARESVRPTLWGRTLPQARCQYCLSALSRIA